MCHHYCWDHHWNGYLRGTHWNFSPNIFPWIGFNTMANRRRYQPIVISGICRTWYHLSRMWRCVPVFTNILRRTGIVCGILAIFLLCQDGIQRRQMSARCFVSISFRTFTLYHTVTIREGALNAHINICGEMAAILSREMRRTASL